MDTKANEYDIPKREGSVWPDDICPAYTPREDAIPSIRGCWYCQYADFHLKEERALEVGICKWPKKIIEQGISFNMAKQHLAGAALDVLFKL